MITKGSAIDTQEFKELAQAAYTRFEDVDVVSRYFEGAQTHTFSDDEERLRHLQLKYFHEQSQWTSLNEMAGVFQKQGRYYLAHMCLAESLRQRPDQDDICLKMLEVKERIQSFRLENRGEDKVPVSVIMTTYQFRPEIRESIESVLGQTFQDFELVIVNDAGPTDVEELIASFQSDKIRYFRLDKNLGLAGARNEGLKRCQGKYICYLDDDDVYLEDHLTLLLEALRDSGKRVTYSSTRAVEGELVEGVFQPARELFVWDEDFDRDTLVCEIYVTTCSIMHERSLLLDAGMFNQDLRSSQDWDLWLRFAKLADFCHVRQVTNQYRISKSNVTVRNRLGAYFYGELICRYHGFRCGEIAETKALFAQEKTAEAVRKYEAIKETFDEGFQAPFVLDEISALAMVAGDFSFAARLTQDYFRKDTRSCLKSICREGSWRKALAVLPLLPAKIARGVTIRIRRTS